MTCIFCVGTVLVFRLQIGVVSIPPIFIETIEDMGRRKLFWDAHKSLIVGTKLHEVMAVSKNVVSSF